MLKDEVKKKITQKDLKNNGENKNNQRASKNFQLEG
jgi:hypothetical protein